MIVIKKVDDCLNVIIATLLNIEHGVKKYVADNNSVQELKAPYEPMLTIELPDPLPYSKPIKLKVNSRYGFIFCLLDKLSIEQFVKILKTKMAAFDQSHLERNITGVSHSTLTVQDAPTNVACRRFIITNHVLNDPVCSGFTWYVSGLIDQVFSPHVYHKMRQIIPMIASVLYDEIDIFTYNHNDIITKSSVSKMKIPQLPESLKEISDALQSDQIGILVNHDLYEIEFISQFSAILCTQLDRVHITCGKGPKKIPKWPSVRKTLAYQTSCEYDCFVCRFPVCSNGYIVTSLVTLNDYIDDDHTEIYCSYIDPILSHFLDSSKSILLCEHCVRIIKYLSKMELELNCYYIRIPMHYRRLVHLSPTTKAYAGLLDSFEIGRESRLLRVSYRDKQFYVIDHRDIKNILVKDSYVRQSNLPLLPVSMFWYNSEVGYR
jgi:hypothetical protein